MNEEFLLNMKLHSRIQIDANLEVIRVINGWFYIYNTVNYLYQNNYTNEITRLTSIFVPEEIQPIDGRRQSLRKLLKMDIPDPKITELEDNQL